MLESLLLDDEEEDERDDDEDDRARFRFFLVWCFCLRFFDNPDLVTDRSELEEEERFLCRLFCGL